VHLGQDVVRQGLCNLRSTGQGREHRHTDDCRRSHHLIVRQGRIAVTGALGRTCSQLHSTLGGQEATRARYKEELPQRACACAAQPTPGQQAYGRGCAHGSVRVTRWGEGGVSAPDTARPPRLQLHPRPS
jgi:hypothetical protein